MKKGLLILDNPKYPKDQTFFETNEVNGEVLLRYSSVDKTWTNPGKEAYSLTNTGNEFIFVDHHLKQKIKIDYCQAEALRALLKLQDKDGTKFNYFEQKVR